MRPDGRRPSARRHFDGCGWRGGWSMTTATALCVTVQTAFPGVREQFPWRQFLRWRTRQILGLAGCVKISKFGGIPGKVGINCQDWPENHEFIPMTTLDAIDR